MVNTSGPSQHTERVMFVVTGFSSFMGVVQNPTQVLVEALSAQRLKATGITLAKHSVLEVSAAGVNEYLESLGQELPHIVRCVPAEDTKASDGLSDTSTEPVTIICVHLGVSHTETFRLESKAYNEASFRVPDTRGYQPHQECITTEQAVSQVVASKLNLDGAAEMLQQQGFDVRVSTDPGRYVCNYLYYKSVQFCQQAAQCDTQIKMHSVFVHVPAFTFISMQKQACFLEAMFLALAASHS